MKTLIRYMILSCKEEPLKPLLFLTAEEADEEAKWLYGEDYLVVRVEVKVTAYMTMRDKKEIVATDHGDFEK